MKKYIVALIALVFFWASLYLFFSSKKALEWSFLSENKTIVAIVCFIVFIILYALFEKLRKKDEQKRAEEDDE
jgi:uncharacterized membrane protein